MLASISSFLPSVLSPTQSKHVQVINMSDTAGSETDHDDAKSFKDDRDISSKKRDKKDKTQSATETFIFVRPPPSKSNHPLNLQVQMVPPKHQAGNGTSPSRSQSLDVSELDAPFYPDTPKTADTVTPHRRDSPVNLTRSNSNQSESSATYSGSTSTASFSSVASSTSTRRTIIPLYNLQAHNVMTNIIVDAGTDAKIAKFNKRGMELIGLAVLEPIEVWGPAPISIAPPRADSFLSPGIEGSPFLRTNRLSISSRPVTPDIPHTPASSSALSLSSASHSFAPHSPTAHTNFPQTHLPPPPDSTIPASRKPQFFGKLFKKKDVPEIIPVAFSPPASPIHDRSPSTPSAAARVTRHFKRASLSVASSSTTPTGSAVLQPIESPSLLFPSIRPSISEPVPASAPPSSPSSSAILRPPVLGIQPTMSSPIFPPIGRPTLYVWVVRRWLKGSDSGILGGVIGRIGASAALAAGKVSGGASATVGSGGSGRGIGAGVEVRFEWKRGRSDRKRRKEKKSSVGTNAVSVDDSSGAAPSTSTASSTQGSPAREASSGGGMGASPGSRRKREHRASIVSFATSEDGLSAGPKRAGRVRGDGDEQVDGEDSDPEDSETPWTCTLKVRRVSDDVGGGGGEDMQVVRVKVGTLSQTPHHPKVVAMLKVPYPLPDVQVEMLVVRKRRPGAATGPWSNIGSGSSGLVLTAEEIKDVVSSTGLWLVVREGFGGVGKVTRKGDGWRIRA